MQDLNLSLVQANPQWHKIEANLGYYDKMFEGINENTDVIALPEMFSTGFTMESAKMAESMNGKTHTWMRLQAIKHDSVICGSIIIEEDSCYYNRFLWVEPNGKTLTYDKRHLFRMADENKSFTAGTEQLIISYHGWKIMPMICYDLRFPVWTRNYLDNDEFYYDVLLYAANWPLARMAVWQTLLKARAIENYAYSIGVNRIGIDEEGISYNGHTGAYAADGQNLIIEDDWEGIKSIKLNYQTLADFRIKFPASKDADQFKIKK